MKGKHFIPYQQGAKPAQGSAATNAGSSLSQTPDWEAAKLADQGFSRE